LQAFLHSFLDVVRKILLIALSALVKALDEAAHIARHRLGSIVLTGFIRLKRVLDVSLGLAVTVNKARDLVLKQTDLITLRTCLFHFPIVIKVLHIFEEV
jgi:hypothetical protein